MLAKQHHESNDSDFRDFHTGQWHCVKQRKAQVIRDHYGIRHHV
jgi:hypothetical protein